MANMKLVGSQWDGACVIACDCGSEEPVTDTIPLADKDLKYDLARRTIDKLEREVIRSRSIAEDTRKIIVKSEKYIKFLELERYNLRRERDRLAHKDTIMRYELCKLVDIAEAPIDDSLFDTDGPPWPWLPPGSPALGKSQEVTDD